MSFPSTVKAIIAPKPGPIEVLELGTLPFPQPKPGEVLIKVQYAGVNFIDTYLRSGLYPPKSLPIVMGVEGSGTVVGLPSEDNVLNDEQYKVKGLSEGSGVAFKYAGSMIEYIAVPWKNISPLPSHISPLVGAAALTQGLTAITFMHEAYDIQKGDIVLVHTVAGGLGLIFSQFAKTRGATVIGTTSSEEKAKLAKAHGADHVILYPVEDTVQRVLEITNGEGVHAIFDGVGKDTFEADFKMIRRKGTLVCVGNASGAVPPFPPLKLVEKNVKIARPTMENYVFTPAEYNHYSKELFDLIADGTIKINVHKEYPFTAEGVQQSQRDITGRSTFGKLIIKVSE